MSGMMDDELSQSLCEQCDAKLRDVPGGEQVLEMLQTLKILEDGVIEEEAKLQDRMKNVELREKCYAMGKKELEEKAVQLRIQRQHMKQSIQNLGLSREILEKKQFCPKLGAKVVKLIGYWTNKRLIAGQYCKLDENTVKVMGGTIKILQISQHLLGTKPVNYWNRDMLEPNPFQQV